MLWAGAMAMGFASWATAAAPAALKALAPEAVVAEAARRVLLEQAERDGLLAPEVEVTVLPSGPAPTCAAPFEAEPVDTRFASRMRFQLRCPGGETVKAAYVVRARVTAEVVITVSAVQAGKPIVASELTLDRREVGTTPDAISDIESVAGKASQRPLRAGQVVQKRLLAEATIVKRGDVVQIEARRGPVQVSASGEALEAGRRGDVVRVRNTTTSKVIRARIVDAGVVEPADMAGSP